MRPNLDVRECERGARQNQGFSYCIHVAPLICGTGGFTCHSPRLLQILHLGLLVCMGRSPRPAATSAAKSQLAHLRQPGQ